MIKYLVLLQRAANTQNYVRTCSHRPLASHSNMTPPNLTSLVIGLQHVLTQSPLPSELDCNMFSPNFLSPVNWTATFDHIISPCQWTGLQHALTQSPLASELDCNMSSPYLPSPVNWTATCPHPISPRQWTGLQHVLTQSPLLYATNCKLSASQSNWQGNRLPSLCQPAPRHRRVNCMSVVILQNLQGNYCVEVTGCITWFCMHNLVHANKLQSEYQLYWLTCTI